jgi:hypothetical protein
MLPLGATITFDTNTLDKAARPERHPKDPARADFRKVREALKTGRLRGYFSQTLVTLEGIEKKDRPEVLGSTRLESQSSSTAGNTINLTIAVKQDRKPRHRELSRRIQAAQLIGMRASRGPARLGDGISVKDAATCWALVHLFQLQLQSYPLTLYQMNGAAAEWCCCPVKINAWYDFVQRWSNPAAASLDCIPVTSASLRETNIDIIF